MNKDQFSEIINRLEKIEQRLDLLEKQLKAKYNNIAPVAIDLLRFK